MFEVIRSVFRKLFRKLYGEWRPERQAFAERVLKSIFGLKDNNEETHE